MRRYTENCCVYIEKIVNLIDYLYLFVTRFNSIGVQYGLRYVFDSFSFAICRVNFRAVVAVMLGMFIAVVITFEFGVSSHAHAMENGETIFVKSVPETFTPKIIYNSLLIDLQTAKFRIIPYSVVQENDPKFFKYVLETSSSISFNGKYIGASYPYSLDPIRSVIENIIVTPNRLDTLKDEFYARSSNKGRLDWFFSSKGLAVNQPLSITDYATFLEDFFSYSVRVKNRLQLNDCLLSNSCIRETLASMYTFVEYLQGTKLFNDKIFMFSNGTKFTLKPFLFDTTFLLKNESTNIGLYLTDNNITLIFNNKVLYNKNNKFDFNLLRPELLKSEVICDTIKIFSNEDIGSNERKLVGAFNKVHGYVRENSVRTANFSFYTTDYFVDAKLNITFLNFSLNDENTLD